MLRLLALALFLCTAPALAQAPLKSNGETENRALLGSQMFVAFQCATFAEMSDNREEQERLFKLGYEAGKLFLAALEAGEISSGQASSTVPLIVMMSLGGPTPDFVIGRIFENSATYAYDSVVKNDEYGVQRKPEEWVTDMELKRAKARNSFHKGNCSLIK